MRDHIAPCQLGVVPPTLGEARRMGPRAKLTGSKALIIISPLSPRRISSRVLLALKVGHWLYQVPQPGAGQSAASVARMISVSKTGSLNLPPARGKTRKGGFR